MSCCGIMEWPMLMYNCGESSCNLKPSTSTVVFAFSLASSDLLGTFHFSRMCEVTEGGLTYGGDGTVRLREDITTRGQTLGLDCPSKYEGETLHNYKCIRSTRKKCQRLEGIEKFSVLDLCFILFPMETLGPKKFISVVIYECVS